jgi:hypothetical protein
MMTDEGARLVFELGELMEAVAAIHEKNFSPKIALGITGLTLIQAVLRHPEWGQALVHKTIKGIDDRTLDFIADNLVKVLPLGREGEEGEVFVKP